MISKSVAQQLAFAEIGEISPVGEMNLRSRDIAQEEETLFDKEARLIGDGKYDDAVHAFLAIPEGERGVYLNARQYLAYIYFEQTKYNEVISILESLLEIGYADESKMQWLLALSYLSINEEGKGLKLIEELAKNTERDNYHQKAKAFLENL